MFSLSLPLLALRRSQSLLVATGVVASWDTSRGTGFLVDHATKQRLFIHFSECIWSGDAKQSRMSLRPNQSVAFECVPDKRRADLAPRAINVRSADGAPLPPGPSETSGACYAVAGCTSATGGVTAPASACTAAARSLIGKQSLGGVLVSWSRGHGFVAVNGSGAQLFLHYSDVAATNAATSLALGDRIVFDVIADPRAQGKPRAVRVRKEIEF